MIRPTPERAAVVRREGTPSRRDPFVRLVGRAWRDLTGTPRGALPTTLVAVSGGADSSALLLAMFAVSPGSVVAAHVVHDLRSTEASEADRDAVRALCLELGVPFADAHVTGRGGPTGNAEADARRARYTVLAGLARQHGAAWVATGHHADDQLETLLMAIMRGAGPRGLRGIASVRDLDVHTEGPGRVRVIRPMLATQRAEAERVCAEAGWTWRVDATNDDVSRTRAALRARVVPVLRELRPAVAERAADTCVLMRDVAACLGDAAQALDEKGRCHAGRIPGVPRGSARTDLPSRPDGGGQSQTRSVRWRRAVLEEARIAEFGELLRGAAGRLGEGAGLDGIRWRDLTVLARAVRDGRGGSRTFRLGRFTAIVTADVLELVAPTHDAEQEEGRSHGSGDCDQPDGEERL